MLFFFAALLLLQQLLPGALVPVVDALPRELGGAQRGQIVDNFRWQVVVCDDDIAIVTTGPAKWLVVAIVRAAELITIAMVGGQK